LTIKKSLKTHQGYKRKISKELKKFSL